VSLPACCKNAVRGFSPCAASGGPRRVPGPLQKSGPGRGESWPPRLGETSRGPHRGKVPARGPAAGRPFPVLGPRGPQTSRPRGPSGSGSRCRQKPGRGGDAPTPLRVCSDRAEQWRRSSNHAQLQCSGARETAGAGSRKVAQTLGSKGGRGPGPPPAPRKILRQTDGIWSAKDRRPEPLRRRASAPCTTPSCASRALIEGSLGHPYTCAEACKHVCKPRGCMDGLASSVCPCRYPVFDRRNKAAGFHGKPPSARGPGQQKREKGRGTRASRELPLAARRSPGRRALGQPSGRAPRESAAPRASGSPRPPPACAGAAGARWGDLQGRVLPEVPLAQRCPQDLQGGPHGPQSTPPLTRSRGPQAPKWSGTLRAPWARGTF
ncbi:unnamed protein product, partial [Prorocentrum cordatum]